MVELRPMIGTSIGKYRFVGQLGRGSMGVVYKAIDETLDREVAIKVLNPELADARVIKRFKSEATTLAKLNHAGIATLYELFEADGDLLIVMEFVGGETLESLAKRMGPLAADHAAYVVDEILSALRHAHRAGVVHCDMKPANVMLTEDGGVKILDFGTARVRGAERATVDKYMMGTPAYMAPEQVQGGELDGRADLYAVGVILYRLLAGALPFNADNVMAMLQKQLSQQPPPLEAHRVGLPEWCDATVQRAMAKDPVDRFQTADGFRAAVRKGADTVKTGIAKASFLQASGTADGAAAAASGIEGFTIAMPSARTVVASPTKEHTIAVRLMAQVGGVTLLLVLVVVWYTRTFYPEPIPMPLQSMVVTPLSGPLAAETSPRTTMPADTPRLRTAPTTVRETRETGIDGKAAPPAVPSADHAPAPLTATPLAAATPVAPVAKPMAPPFVFEARVLTGEDDKQRERECRVVLAEGRINVQPTDEAALLYAVPYEAVVSISYSRGRDPLFHSPAGPTRVTRTGRGVLDVFRGTRHWVAVRASSRAGEFITLRFGNEADARRAALALQERTGHIAAVVESK